MKTSCYRLQMRPESKLTSDCFLLDYEDLAAPKENEILVEVHHLSIDPYMRGRISDQKSYANPIPIGDAMIGGVIGKVIESRDDRFVCGDWVVGTATWSEYCVLNGNNVRRINSKVENKSLYLGALGMPGVTAWYGINQLLNVAPGKTIVVSSAAGTVGSVAGQIARRKNCRVIGIAGSNEKCRFAKEFLKFDDCINYKDDDFDAQLNSAVSGGVDGIFENVGGKCFDACLPHLNPYSSIALCGLISIYDGMDYPIKNFRYLLSARATLKGFIITEQMSFWSQALQELEDLYLCGQLEVKESMYSGLASAPLALVDLLNGNHFGKQIVNLRD